MSRPLWDVFLGSVIKELTPNSVTSNKMTRGTRSESVFVLAAIRR